VSLGYTRPPLVEERITEIWRRVLETDAVDRDQDFFDAGGDSLAAIQLAAEIERELGVECSPEVVFEHSTIAELVDRFASETAERPG
jgi:acyl carrier protein